MTLPNQYLFRCFIATKYINVLQNDVLVLNRDIELGQSKDAGTDRDLHEWWDEFKEQKELFDSLFDEKICTEPELLEEIHNEMVRLHEKVIKST